MICMQLLRVFVIPLALLLLSCTSTLDVTPPVTRKFEIVTSEALSPFVLELTDAYHRAHTFISFNIRSGNAAFALAELSRLNADAVFVGRALAQTDLTRLNAEARLIGRDGLVIIVNPSNSLQSVTRDQVTKIFAGDIHDWRDLGARLPTGASPVIAVVSREEGSASREVFEGLMMTGKRVTRTALVEPSERDVAEYVAAQPDAIGYISLQSLSSRVRGLALNGTEATLANIANKKYPLEHPVYLVNPSHPSADLDEFIAFVAGPDARHILEKYIAVQ